MLQFIGFQDRYAAAHDMLNKTTKMLSHEKWNVTIKHRCVASYHRYEPSVEGFKTFYLCCEHTLREHSHK
jgi:hypothetical protein